MAKRIQPQQYNSTVADIISESFSELESLGEEMRERYDNAPENLQATEVNQRVEEAADALEALSEPEVPECVAQLPVTFSFKPQRRQSRPDRRNQATERLSLAKSAIEDWQEEQEEEHEDVDTLLEEIQQLIDDADNIEFPGMRG
jgi:molecular chaperone DnaK (HSP70)